MRYMDHDPFTGITTYFKKEGDKNILMEIQDIDPILEKNKREAEVLDKKRNFWKVGEIPMVICQQWAQECGAVAFSPEWQAYAKKKLNSTDYRKLNVNKIKL